MYGKFQKILTGKVQFLRLSSKLLNLSIPYAMKVECLKLDFCATKREKKEKRRVEGRKSSLGAERNRLLSFSFCISIFW